MPWARTVVFESAVVKSVNRRKMKHWGDLIDRGFWSWGSLDIRTKVLTLRNDAAITDLFLSV